MAAVLLRPPPQVDRCRFCGATAPPAAFRAGPGESAVRFHPCPAQGGLTVPMAPAFQPAEVRKVEREEYIGDEDVQVDGQGRPVMAFVTIRDDGNDCAVMAPTAHLNLRKDG